MLYCSHRPSQGVNSSQNLPKTSCIRSTLEKIDTNYKESKRELQGYGTGGKRMFSKIQREMEDQRDGDMGRLFQMAGTAE